MCASDLLIYEAAIFDLYQKRECESDFSDTKPIYHTEERRKQDSHIIRGMSGVCLSCWGIGQGLGPTRAQARG